MNQATARKRSTGKMLRTMMIATVMAALSAPAPAAARDARPVFRDTEPGLITRMVGDQERYFVYALRNDPAGPDSLLVIDTTDDSVRARVPVTDDPSDLAVGYLEGVLFVIGFAHNQIDVFDLVSLQKIETITFPAPDNDPDGLGYHLASGRADRLYYTDAAAVPAVHVLDRHTGADLGAFDFDGVGALAMGPDHDRLYAGRRAGWTPSGEDTWVLAIDCGSDVLTVAQESDPFSPGDALDIPLLISGEGDLLACRDALYQTADLATPPWTVPGDIRAMSRQAEVLFTSDQAYDPRTGDLLHTFDFPATAVAVSGDQQKIYRYDAVSGEIGVTLMSDIAAVPAPGLNPVPDAGATVVLPLACLTWETVPSALAYRVYLGQDPVAVAQATVDSPEYLGEVADNLIALDRELDLDTDYYWRLDLVTLWGPFPAEVWNFHTAPIKVTPNPVELTAPTGVSSFSAPLAVYLANATVKWTYGEDISWLSISSGFGAPPPMLLSLDVDLTGLQPGRHQGNLHFTWGTEAFEVPVQLTVPYGPQLEPTPADEATIIAPLAQLAWTNAPDALGYRVFLGQDPDAVALATVDSPEYRGETFDPVLALTEDLPLAAECWWRVDVLLPDGAVTGPVWSFAVAPVAMTPNPLVVTVTAGEVPEPALVQMWSDLPLGRLRRYEDLSWLAINEGFGQFPDDELRITFHSENLDPGLYTGQINFLYGEYTFALPVALTVEDPMSATALDGFTALREGRGVVLSWRALELDPGVAFAVLRQQEGGALEPVAALVEQTGTAFRAFDTAPPAGSCSYWLQAALPGGAQLTCGPALVQTAPLATGLGRNHPNPFNPETSIEFSLAAPGRIQVLVFDVSGRRVATLVDERLPAGPHTARWLGRDDRGRPVNSGVYFVQLRSPEGVQTRKMMLVK